MRTVVRVLTQALVIGFLWGAAAGHAQISASNKVRARELYTQGQQQFRQGDFVGAQRAFEDAYRAVPNPVVLLSISECQVRAEDYTGAIASLRQYLNEKPGAPDRAQVEAQIANLEAKPGFVSVESAPTGAMIWVDGENTGYITPNELSLRAGRHAIALTAPGYLRTEEPVDVTIGSRQRFSLTLTPEPPPQVAEQPAQAPPTEDTGRAGRRRGSPAVWASLAVALVTAGTGTGLGVAALKKDRDYDSLSKERPVDEAQLDQIKKKGERMALFADVNFGIAAVAGVTALVLYLTSLEGSESQGEQQAWSIGPTLTAREAGVAGAVRF